MLFPVILLRFILPSFLSSPHLLCSFSFFSLSILIFLVPSVLKSRHYHQGHISFTDSLTRAYCSYCPPWLFHQTAQTLFCFPGFRTLNIVSLPLSFAPNILIHQYPGCLILIPPGQLPPPSCPTWMQSRDSKKDTATGAAQGTALLQHPSTPASPAVFLSHFLPLSWKLGCWSRLQHAKICCNTEPMDWAAHLGHAAVVQLFPR